MPALIAVITCWSNLAAAEAIRRTWAKLSPIPVVFFLGHRHQKRHPLPDEIVLPCEDSYECLTSKVKHAFQWARAAGFTNLLKCDDDIYVRPERLVPLIGRHDHVGMLSKPARRIVGDVECRDGFCHGGAGYLLNKSALDVLCNAPVNAVSEDAWSTFWINKAGLQSVHDPRFKYTKRVFGDRLPDVPLPDNDLITGGEIHTLAGGRSEMIAVHRQFEI